MCGCFAGIPPVTGRSGWRPTARSTMLALCRARRICRADVDPLGRSLPDLWSGSHHRGVQLHDLRAAVLSGPTGMVSGRGYASWNLRRPRRDGGRAPAHHRAGWTARRFRPRRGSSTGGCPGTCRRSGGVSGTPTWRPPTAPSWSPSRTRPWDCCRPAGSPTGMTPAASGAGMISTFPQGPGSAGRSPYRSLPGRVLRS